MEFSDNESKAGRRGHRDFYEDAKEIEETRRQRNLITTASFSFFPSFQFSRPLPLTLIKIA